MNMKKILVGWNRVYGCQPFEVNITRNFNIKQKPGLEVVQPL